MANAWTVSIDWRIYLRIIATLLCGNEILLGTRDAKLLHPEVKRRPLDSQTCGRPVGAGDNPAGQPERLANEVSPRVVPANCPKGFCVGGTLQARDGRAQGAARTREYLPTVELQGLAG